MSSVITEILENVKVFIWRRRRHQGYDNTSTFSSKNSRAKKRTATVKILNIGTCMSEQTALTTFPFFTFALAGCLQSFHPTHAQLRNRNGKFVFSETFHIMWVEVGQGILRNRSIFLNKSNQLCINIT